jgi:glycosyltransferase involved in cell wall biosynthesis
MLKNAFGDNIRLDKMSNKSALIVFEAAFRYGWRCSTPRIMEFAKALRMAGWEPSILATSRCSHEPGIEQEKAFPGQVIRTPFWGTYPSYTTGRYSRFIWRILCRISGRSKYFDDPRYGWVRRFPDWLATSKDLDPPAVIIAISTGHISSMATGRFLSSHFGVPMILDIQDPVPSPESKPYTPEEQSELERCIEHACAVVTTTKKLGEHLAEKYNCQCKTFPIHMSYEKLNMDEIESATGSQPVVLLHAGTLYGGPGRNAKSLVKALARAFDIAPGARGQIKLRLLGGGAGGLEAVKLAKKCKVDVDVENLIEVPPYEALRAMAQADVLVLIKFANPKFDMQVPGKLFQYLSFTKPILGVMGHCEASEIITASGVGTVVANDDVETLAQYMLSVWRNRDTFRSCNKPDLEYISQFSLSSLANRLGDILQVCIASPTAAVKSVTSSRSA